MGMNDEIDSKPHLCRLTYDPDQGRVDVCDHDGSHLCTHYLYLCALPG